MKKEIIEKKVLQVVGKVISLEVKKNSNIWPPLCCGFVHQPKRPIMNKGK
ncbi:MAG: cyclic lactone autoinducer peptide [Lachnospiraceae bacterium]|nr:cyclic lactone autoinducer peptide [Lachnospiraceae bacterium]